MLKFQDDNEATLIIHLRPSRQKAREVAIAEILAVVRDLGGVRARGGPLSEIRGITWVGLPESNTVRARSRLCRLGYTNAIDLVRPVTAGEIKVPQDAIKWKGRYIRLERIYDESDEHLRDMAPDRRTFLLECGDGVVRPIQGYRGGQAPFEHRALPVVDARLLVNLVFQPTCGVLLDPFAGAGGIIIEARAAGWTTVSLDNDPALRFGLAELADNHILGTSTKLPLARGSVDAIASEPPYHPTGLDIVITSIPEFARVLRLGGRISLLVASTQTEFVLAAAEKENLKLELNEPINRKGTSVSCLCWVRCEPR